MYVLYGEKKSDMQVKLAPPRFNSRVKQSELCRLKFFCKLKILTHLIKNCKLCGSTQQSWPFCHLCDINSHPPRLVLPARLTGPSLEKCGTGWLHHGQRSLCGYSLCVLCTVFRWWWNFWTLIFLMLHFVYILAGYSLCVLCTVFRWWWNFWTLIFLMLHFAYILAFMPSVVEFELVLS